MIHDEPISTASRGPETDTLFADLHRQSSTLRRRLDFYQEQFRIEAGRLVNLISELEARPPVVAPADFKETVAEHFGHLAGLLQEFRAEVFFPLRQVFTSDDEPWPQPPKNPLLRSLAASLASIDRILPGNVQLLEWGLYLC